MSIATCALNSFVRILTIIFQVIEKASFAGGLSMRIDSRYLVFGQTAWFAKVFRNHLAREVNKYPIDGFPFCELTTARSSIG